MWNRILCGLELKGWLLPPSTLIRPIAGLFNGGIVMGTVISDAS